MTETLVGLILRHGETDLNDENCFRSWLDVPLNPKGIKHAEAARDFLSQYKLKLANIISSPLLRAFVTADIVSGPSGVQVYQHRGLFPWRLGVFSGLPRDENNDALRLFVKNPHVCIPGGESLDDFEDRQFAFWKAALHRAKGDGLTLYVAHTSNVVSLINFTEDAETSEPEMGNEAVKPGGIGGIYFDGAKHRVEVLFGVEEPAIFGGS